MSTSQTPIEHPLLAAVRGMDEALDDTAVVDPMFMSPTLKCELLVRLTRVVDRLQARRAGVLAVADDVAIKQGVRSPAAWLAGESRTSLREAISAERIGGALADRWSPTAEAAADGRLSWDQTVVLVRALDALPDDLDPELVTKAEAQLIAEAGHFGPRELARLGRRVLEVVAPDVADAEEARALAEAERRARKATRLNFRPRGDGSTDLHARLPDHVASRLRSYLDAFTSPRRRAPFGDVDRLPMARRRGEAFCALLEQLPADGLPVHGGTATSVMVTIDVESLRSGLGLAETSTGETITAQEARRLACMASILPVVLGGAGEILDLGRARRLFSPGQRKAMAIRDRHCRAEGCDIPAAWCEAHHAAPPWSKGGRTDLDDGVLLCSFHHHRAHDARWDASRLPNGDVRYSRRT
ncbi:MAG: DUF222 domain-containing protein [Nocardioides sp.]